MNRYPEAKVKPYMPEAAHVAIADRRLDGFIEAWAHSGEQDLKVLLRSAYLQGLADMADTAARMTTTPFIEVPQGYEWLP